MTPKAVTVLLTIFVFCSVDSSPRHRRAEVEGGIAEEGIAHLRMDVSASVDMEVPPAGIAQLDALGWGSGDGAGVEGMQFFGSLDMGSGEDYGDDRLPAIPPDTSHICESGERFDLARFNLLHHL
jgi:hypothetical protein